MIILRLTIKPQYLLSVQKESFFPCLKTKEYVSMKTLHIQSVLFENSVHRCTVNILMWLCKVLHQTPYIKEQPIFCQHPIYRDNLKQLTDITVIIWNIGTDRSEQTVQTKIRLLLKEQSDQCLLCLLFCLHLLNAILPCKIQLFHL